MNHENLLDAAPLPEFNYSEALDLENAQAISKLISAALVSGEAVAAAGEAGYVYDRKGYATVDQVGTQRSIYGSPEDDLYLQIQIRIPQHTLSAEAREIFESLEDAANQAAMAEASVRLEELRRKREEAEAAEKKALERLEKLRKR